MGQRFKSACMHIEVWTARSHLTDRPHELLTTPPPPHSRYPDEMTRMRLSASLCTRATYSGRPSGVENSQADHRVASERGYAPSCIPTSENSSSTYFVNKGKGKKGRRTDQQRRTEQKPRARNASRLRALFRFYQRCGTPPDRAEGEASLRTAPPGRLVSVRTVVGDWDPTSPAGVDGVDLFVFSVVAF